MATDDVVVVKTISRNLIAFWILGLCNTFAYIVMLAAAQDILSKGDNSTTTAEDECLPQMSERHCSPQSAAIVLLCNIFPGLIVKVIFPFIAKRIPYGVRHVLICLLQASSLIVTALADSVSVALTGVMLASISSAMGECTYIALTSYYNKKSITWWASGTGMAGMSGAFSYALLTTILDLSPTQAMLCMLVVPITLFFTYHKFLIKPDDIKEAEFFSPVTWIHLDPIIEDPPQPQTTEIVQKKRRMDLVQKAKFAKKLMKFMLPLYAVYFAEYLINQGLLELTVFDCAHGFATSPQAQYRWYQVLYQIGVFASRSSSSLIQLNIKWIAILSLLQLLNTCFFLINAVFSFVPHFGVAAAIVLYEGLIGGASYVNRCNLIHKKIHPSMREFALSVATLADTTGILTAALIAVPLHNSICALP